MPPPHRRFTQEFRDEAVRLAETSGRTRREIAGDLGIGLSTLRHWIGLAQTRLAQATCGTIRLKLLKIGALVRLSVRRVKIAMASGCPYAREWALAHARLCRTIAA